MSYLLLSEELKYRSFSCLVSRFRSNPWQIYAAQMLIDNFILPDIRHGLLTTKQAKKILRLKVYLAKFQKARNLAYEKAFNATPEELGAAALSKAKEKPIPPIDEKLKKLLTSKRV